MVKINFAGAFFGTSGFACHLRGLALAMKKLNVETSVECQLPQGWEKAVSGEEFDLLSTSRFVDGWQVVISHPASALFKLADKNKGVLPFMVFEGDKAPKQWALLSEKFPLILVPSNHTRQALINAGVKEDKIVIVPHGFDPETYNEVVDVNNPFLSNKCTFIWNKGWSKGIHDRSAFHVALRSFLEEFKDVEDVRLLCHINPAYNVPGWNIEQEVLKLNIPELANKKCELSINCEALPPNVMANFYKAGNIFLGVSKAEAFHLPCLEAMACGLPVITATFGGMIDYVPNEGNIFIGGELEPASIVDLNDLAIYEQAKWLNINIDELKKAMRNMYELWKHNPIKLKEIGENNSDIAEHWIWEKSAKKLLDTIAQLEK